MVFSLKLVFHLNSEFIYSIVLMGKRNNSGHLHLTSHEATIVFIIVTIITIARWYLDEMFRVVFEDGVESVVVQTGVFVPLVVVVVDEVLNVVVRPNVLNILQAIRKLIIVSLFGSIVA